MQISVKTGSRTQMIDITAKVREVVAASGIQEGLVHVYSMHTTGRSLSMKMPIPQ